MASGKAPGTDKIPIRVIKECLPAILPPSTSIINVSIIYHALFSFLSSNSLRSCLNGSDMSLYHHSVHLLLDPFKPSKVLFHPTRCLTDLTMMDEVELKCCIHYHI